MDKLTFSNPQKFNISVDTEILAYPTKKSQAFGGAKGVELASIGAY